MQARDVRRLTDKSNIEKVLELYKSKKWEYPEFDKEDGKTVFWTGVWEKVNDTLAVLPRDPMTNKLYEIKFKNKFPEVVIKKEKCEPLTKQGITIVADLRCAEWWKTYNFEWIEYYIARDNEDIKNKIFRENFQANRIVTTKVTDMIRTFGLSSFNQDISNWDVSNVRNMTHMFYRAEKFNQPLNNWNVSNVTNMEGMFFWTKSFNQPLNNWNVANVRNMSEMFLMASSFNQPLNNWNVSNVRNMRYMFQVAGKFNQPLNNWDVSNVTDMQAMFAQAISFNQDISNWDVSNVTDMTHMFSDANSFNQNISKWDVSKVSDWRYFSSLSLENLPPKFR